MSRRPKGEGTYYKHKTRNLWVGQYPLPNGKRKTKYAKTQKEVIEINITQLVNDLVV